MNRQEANRLIVKQISDLVEGCPELRFQQILSCLKITKSKKIVTGYTVRGAPIEEMVCEDLFNEESTKTLEIINSNNG